MTIITTFSCGASGKEPACQYRKRKERWVPSLGWEDALEEGMAIHSSILCLENPMDRGAWRATVHWVAELDITEGTWHECINKKTPDELIF